MSRVNIPFHPSQLAREKLLRIPYQRVACHLSMHWKIKNQAAATTLSRHSVTWHLPAKNIDATDPDSQFPLFRQLTPRCYRTLDKRQHRNIFRRTEPSAAFTVDQTQVVDNADKTPQNIVFNKTYKGGTKSAFTRGKACFGLFNAQERIS